jgi:ubiquinone biosynthesis protein
LVEFAQKSGATYVKLGQILSTRRDLFNDAVIAELELLQDEMPPISFPLVPELFRDELGVQLSDVFSEFDPIPVASASIASVYRARLHDGTAVAVKVRRPELETRIQADLRVIRLLAGLIERLPGFRSVPLLLTVDELACCLERQIDFRLEASANKRLTAALADEPSLTLPVLVERLCSSSIITMQFIEGLQAPHKRRGAECRTALLVALHALFRMIFAEGFVHCDMHQGNLHLFADGRAVLVDFGFVAELRPADRIKFAEFFLALAINNGRRCARITLETAGSVPKNLAYERFERQVVELVNTVSGASAREFQVVSFVTGMFDVQRRFRIRGTTGFMMAIVSLLVFEGIAKEVDPDLDFQREAMPFVLRASAGY